MIAALIQYVSHRWWVLRYVIEEKRIAAILQLNGLRITARRTVRRLKHGRR